MAVGDYIIAGQPTPPTNTAEIPSQSSGPAPNDPSAFQHALIDSIIKAESSKNPYAVGKKGEIGLMQIMPSTAAQFGVTPPQLFDPKINRQVGTRYFNMLLSRYQGDPEKALMAYNGGMKNVDRGTVAKSAREYAQKILRAAGSAFEGTAYAEEPPLPKGFSDPSGPATKGGSAAPTEPPLPPGFTDVGAKPAAKPLPWAVRAADWAPAIGQFGGAGAAGFASGMGSFGTATVPGAMAGAVLGTDAGERVRNAMRGAYGLPTASAGDIVKSDLMGAGAELGAPILSRVLRPAARAVATKAASDYEAAMTGAQKAISGLESLLGKTKGKALSEAADASAAAPFKQAVSASRKSAFDALGQQYDALLSPFKTNKTLGSLNRAFAREASMVRAVGMDIPPELKNKILNSPQTVQSAQEIESMARRAARGMTDSRFGPLKHALDEIAKSAHEDIKAAMPPQAGQAYDELTRRYAETVTQFENADKVIHSPNLPSAADKLFNQEQSQLYTTLKSLDRLPTATRDKALDGLRSGFSNRALQAMNEAGSNPVAQFKATEKFIRSVPDGVFERLYPGTGVTKNEMLNGLEKFNEFHAQILKSPDQAAAVDKALQQFVKQKPYILHHLQRMGMWPILGLAVGAHELGASAQELGAIFGGLMLVKGWQSARTSRLMLAAAKSPTAAKAATEILRAVEAWGNEEIKTGVGLGGRDEEEAQSQP